jgi:hypothetical protein
MYKFSSLESRNKDFLCPAATMPNYMDLEVWGCDDDVGLDGKPGIEELVAQVVSILPDSICADLDAESLMLLTRDCSLCINVHDYQTFPKRSTICMQADDVQRQP